MGTNYDGEYFYGLLFDEFDGDEEAENWPTSTRIVLGDHEDYFEDWLCELLEMPPSPKMPTLPPPASWHEERGAWVAERERRCVERFGVEWFEDSFLGFVDYNVRYICPKGAQVCEWRGARVPEWTPQQLHLWEAACEKLRDLLPGSGRPGLYFGCRVG